MTNPRENLINQYKALHKAKKSYGRGFVNNNYFDEILLFYKDKKLKSVLDFGCGKGRMVDFLNKNNISCQGYDPAIKRFAQFPHNKNFDLVLSFDVFEHFLIETWQEELGKIKSVKPKYIYLKIATTKARQHLPNGMNCHTLVRSKEWWSEELQNNLQEHKKIFEERVSSRPSTITFIFEKIQ